MAKRKNGLFTKVMSVVIGLMLGSLFGLYLREFLPAGILFATVAYAVPMLFWGFLGYKRPITTEGFAFAIPFVILMNNLHDLATDDRTMLRFLITFFCIAIIGVNIFTGKLRIGSFKKIAQKSIGR